MAKIKEIFEEDRPREQAEKLGISNLNNTQLLALIINSGVRGHSCIEIANEILFKYRTILNISKLKFDDFYSIDGLNKARIYRLLAIFELYKRLNVEINSKYCEGDYRPIELVKEFINIGSCEEEKLLVICLKNNDRTKVFEYTVGLNEYVKVNINCILKMIKETKSNNVILLHNHLDDDALPSNDDLFSTFRFENYLKNEKIKLLDHIIISNKNYFSFYEEKMLS